LDDRRLRVGAVVVLVAMVVGAAALGAAMYLYPGGSFVEPHALRHSFWLNFLCDLTGDLALGGAPNPAAPIARAAMGAFAVSLVAFWLILPAHLTVARSLALCIRVAGAMSAVALAVVPLATGSLHAVVVFAVAVPGLVACVTGFGALVRPPRDRLSLAAASGAIAAGAIDAVLYARRVADDYQSCPPALPALQRVAFLFMLLWMAATAWRVLTFARRREVGQGPRGFRPHAM
jgi:hypothetical protein